MNILTGYRTYLCLGVACATYLARYFFPQYVPQEVADTVMAIFGFGSVAALRAAVVAAIAQAAAMTPPVNPTLDVGPQTVKDPEVK